MAHFGASGKAYRLLYSKLYTYFGSGKAFATQNFYTYIRLSNIVLPVQYTWYRISDRWPVTVLGSDVIG